MTRVNTKSPSEKAFHSLLPGSSRATTPKETVPDGLRTGPSRSSRTGGSAKGPRLIQVCVLEVHVHGC